MPNSLIPKKIWTIWIGGEIPEKYKLWIESQKLEGYEHTLITNENNECHDRYVEEALASKNWVKAADYIRMWYLHKYGGIYLDADMEVLPGKNFDHLLNSEMFISMQACGHYANAGVGSIAGHWVLKEYLDRVNRNFKGDGDLIYDCGVRMFSDVLWIAQKEKRADKIAFLPVEMFYPYNHESGVINVTPMSIVYHHYTKSWIPETPKISFVIPTLGREEGLKRCIDSIEKLNYPQDKIEVIIKQDSFENRVGVPNLLKQGVEKSTGEWVVFASNDVEFTPDSIREALKDGNKGFVAFNTNVVYPDEGNICEHFMIRKDIIGKIGEVFDTEFHHVGVDNLLWAKMKKLGIEKRSEKAVVKHYHFSQGATNDEIYKLGWSWLEKDRELLKKKLAEL